MVFVDTRLSKTKHPRKRFQHFRQWYMLSTDRIEIHQSQPASMTWRRLFNGLFMGWSSTLIYTSELILCSTICVSSATRHNIHMYPYFLFAAIHHLKSSPNFSVRPCSSFGRVTVDLIRRSWVRFPPRSKDFFFASCGSLLPFTRANTQWDIHGFK